MDENASIQNSGNIFVVSDNTEASGIVLGSGGSSSFSMSGNSFINNSGKIEVAINNDYAFGIQVQNDIDQNASIQNSGNIFVTSNDGGAFGVYIGSKFESSDMFGNSSIINSGEIEVSADQFAVGVSAWSMEDSASIINTGAISAYIDGALSVNAYSLSLHSMSENAFIQNYGALNGNIYIPGSLRNAGIITLPSNTDNGFYNTNINNFTNTSDGTLVISVFNTDESDIEYSKLTTQTATFEAGSTIGVNVLSDTGSQELLIDKTLEDVVTADNDSLNIEGTLNVTDNSALLDFEYVIDENTIDLNVVEGMSISDATEIGGGKANALKTASVLDEIKEAKMLSSLIGKLNELENEAAVASTVASLSPDVTNALPGASKQITSGVQSIIDLKQNVGVRGLSSGDAIFSDNYLWVKPYGSIGKQKNKNGINGFDLEAYGLAK